MTRLLHKNRWQRTTDISVRCLQSMADKANPVISCAGCRCRRSHCSCLFHQSDLDLYQPLLAHAELWKTLLSCFLPLAQCERAKVIRIWWTESFIWNCLSCRVPAALLNIVSQWHNRGQEMDVNTRLKNIPLYRSSLTKEKWGCFPQQPYNMSHSKEQLSDS